MKRPRRLGPCFHFLNNTCDGSCGRNHLGWTQLTPEKQTEKKEWDNKRKANQQSKGVKRKSQPPAATSNEQGNSQQKYKPLCAAFMLGNCSEGDNCGKYHPKALKAKVKNMIEKSAEQGISLFGKAAPSPSNAAPGDASGSATAKANAKAKAKQNE